MHEPQDGRPTISQPVALAIAASFAVFYVAPFYIYKSLRVNDHVSRNSPASIKARSHAVFQVCVLCIIITLNIHTLIGPITPSQVLKRMGVYPIDLLDVIRSMSLVCILFAGPLFEEGIVQGHWRSWLRWRTVKAGLYDDWMGWRAYVVGPLSEEIIFRSLNISLLLCAWTPGTKIVWQAPLLFGIAHLHHLNEFVIMHRGRHQSYLSAWTTPGIVLPGIARSTFQMGFTTLFGMFVTFVFLRTGNVYTCILQHSFCNWMGLPRVWGRVGQSCEDEFVANPHAEQVDAADQSGSMQGPGPVTSANLGLQWTVAYYVLLFGGAYGFWALLFPLTESDNQLVHL